MRSFEVLAADLCTGGVLEHIEWTQLTVARVEKLSPARSPLKLKETC
jgi:hypothetical protein